MKGWLARALVFYTSAAVLTLEILAGRMMAPFVGITLETFTAIIGTVLAGISLGTWIGGKLADQRDPRTYLPMVLAGGSALTLAIPVVIAVVGPGIQGSGPGGVLILTTIAFFAPATVLSMVPPSVVKLQLDNLDSTGTVVGRLSALGTAGAIFGTFVTGFVLVAALPSKPIVYAVGVSLLVAAVVTGRSTESHKAFPMVMVIAVTVAGLLSAFASSPCDAETAYVCARIVPDDDRTSGRLLLLDTVRHSYVDLDDPTHLEFSYAQTFGDVISTLTPQGPLDVLHVGGGGFTFPNYIEAVRPGSTSVVLELDPGLVRLAEEELGLVTSADLEVRTGDARMTLLGTPEAGYDLVVGDAFGGLVVPWHLTTVEFTEQLAARLRPGGTYLLNAIDHPPNRFLRAETATLMEVFAHVVVLAPQSRIDRSAGGNFVLVASDSPIDADAILENNRLRGDDEVACTDECLVQFVDGEQPLRDEFAPVDQLFTP